MMILQLFRRVAAALPGMEQPEKKAEDSILDLVHSPTSHKALIYLATATAASATVATAILASALCNVLPTSDVTYSNR